MNMSFAVCCFFQIVKAAWWLAQDLTLGIWMGFDAASSRSNWQLSCDIRVVVCQDIELCYWLITLMSELNQNAQAHRWIGGWLSTQVLIASWCNNKSCQSDFRVCFSCSLLLACSSCDGCDTDICTQCWWVVIVWLLAVVCCTSELFINFVWAWPFVVLPGLCYTMFEESAGQFDSCCGWLLTLIDLVWFIVGYYCN